MNVGEAKRITSSEWEFTIKDLCDLMENLSLNIGGQQEFAARAISFVMSNLERRGLINDQFIDIRDIR